MRAKAAKVVLVGSPNVGKSAIFNYLTGSYVTVSNYPGTTVDLSTGQFEYGRQRFEVIDTPGMYSLIPLTEEELVTRQVLTCQTADIVVHVVDAKQIRRMLALTIQLIDAGLPVILTMNIMDEAQDCGMLIDIQQLEQLLGIPVVATSVVRRIGLAALKQTISRYKPSQPASFTLSAELEQTAARIAVRLTASYGLSSRSVALLLLQGDRLISSLSEREKRWTEIAAVLAESGVNKNNLAALIASEQQVLADTIAGKVVRQASIGMQPLKSLAGWLGKITREPVTGIPILCLVLYFGVYQFVGVFGAGYLVDYLNNHIFVPFINPAAASASAAYIPWDWLRSLLTGEYGIFTMGFRYAIAIILPIVGTFFLMFALLEDSGYLPRLSLLADGIFRHLGLNGRAVIPLTLGLGCGTMAVIVNRTLESRRERILATFLLSLSIPCSAQLGIVLALLAHNPAAVAVWSLYLLAVFVIAGWLGAQLVPGKRSAFYLEIPPLRLPLASNVLKKAYARVRWYFMEILPVFIAASMLLWAGEASGILDQLVRFIEPCMALIGLPPAAAQVFLLGFFRRDYGAAGLYELSAAGRLTDTQLLIAAVALTLFVPCVAQFAVMIKERGVAAALIMVVLITLIAFGSAAIIYHGLVFFAGR